MNLVNQQEKLVDTPKRARLEHGGTGYRRGLKDYPRHIDQFLTHRLGEPWAKVVSEFITKEWVALRYRRASFLAKHVETNTFIENDEVYYFATRRHWGDAMIRILDESEQFYVDPVSKTLCRTPKKVYKRPVQPVAYVVLGKFIEAEKRDGIWYLFWCEDTEYARTYYNTKSQRALSEYINEIQYEKREVLGKWERFPIPKTKIYMAQLNHDELRRYGLKNDVKPLPQKKCQVCGGWDCKTLGHNENKRSSEKSWIGRL